MNTNETGLSPLSVSIPLAVLVAITACAGIFWPPTYARETLLWAAQGMGGDAVNLVVIVPVLLISALLARRGSIAARLIWMGTLVFLVYNFFIYAMAVHFNALFLAYCGILGGSFYAFVLNMPSLSNLNVADSYGRRAPVKTVAGMFFVIGFAFAALWLGDIVPALISGQAPKSVTDTGLFTSPVYVLDLSLMLPGLIITAILLLRRNPVALILAPMLMVFCVLITVAIAGMMVAMAVKGFETDYLMAAAFLAPAAVCTVLLVRYLRAGNDKPHVCPWWLGYFLAGRFRRFLQDPAGMLAPYIREGMTVLEPGPGMGFFTLEMARLAGPAGRVVAVDLQPRMIQGLKRRLANAGLLARVDARVVSYDSLAIGDLAGSVDFALAFAMVHELPPAHSFFAEVAEALKPGGSMLLVEPSGHVKRPAFEAELSAAKMAGFEIIERPTVRHSWAALLRKSR